MKSEGSQNQNHTESQPMKTIITIIALLLLLPLATAITRRAYQLPKRYSWPLHAAGTQAARERKLHRQLRREDRKLRRNGRKRNR